MPAQVAPVLLELGVPAPSHRLHQSRGLPAGGRRLLLALAVRASQVLALPLLLPGTHLRSPGEALTSSAPTGVVVVVVVVGGGGGGGGDGGDRFYIALFSALEQSSGGV